MLQIKLLNTTLNAQKKELEARKKAEAKKDELIKQLQEELEAKKGELLILGPVIFAMQFLCMHHFVSTAIFVLHIFVLLKLPPKFKLTLFPPRSRPCLLKMRIFRNLSKRTQKAADRQRLR